MAEATAIVMMLEHIGFKNTAVGLITGDQDIDSVDEVKTLDDKIIENMCNVIHRPEGTAIGGGADTGIEVSARAEENLNISIYYANIQERVSHADKIGFITLENIYKLNNQRETDKNHTDTELPPKIDSKDWLKTMEAVEDYFPILWSEWQNSQL